MKLRIKTFGRCCVWLWVCAAWQVQAATVWVTSSADDGPCTLRAAVAMANADRSVEEIRFTAGLTVELESAVVYTGSQDLVISGEGSAVTIADGVTDAFPLLTVASGASLLCESLALEGSNGDGLLVAVPPDAAGNIKLVLNDVLLVENAGFGVHFADSDGSPASATLILMGCEISRNGTGASDLDGVRVDETGPGHITAVIGDSLFLENGADGLELDEGDDGNVSLVLENSAAVGNGYFDEEDPDDGIDIDEAGPGGVHVRIQDAAASGNADQGLDFDEAGPGDVVVEIRGFSGIENDDGEALKVDEEDNGSMIVRLQEVEVADNRDDGMQFGEVGNGSLHVELENAIVTGSKKYGVKAEQADNGSGMLILRNVAFADNKKGDVDTDNVTVKTLP